jgi:AcrR family transcriptional regulator
MANSNKRRRKAAERSTKSRLETARERMYRDLVFESAEHVFAAKGFDDATMQEIASEAGISLKTLYATFPGKNELYQAIQERRGHEIVEATGRAYSEGGSADEKLNGGVRAYVDYMLEHADFLRIHLREGKAWGLRPSDAVAEDWQVGVGNFASIVREGIASGDFYDGDADLLAMSGVAIMQVYMARIAETAGDIEAGALAEEILLPLRRLLCKPDGRESGRQAA